MTGNELNEIREDGKEFAELAKKIPKEKKREALRLLEGFLLCAEYSVKKAGQEVQEMLKKIYTELVLIRKELQAIRNSMESSLKFSIDSRRVAKDISQIQVCQDSRLCRK